MYKFYLFIYYLNSGGPGPPHCDMVAPPLVVKYGKRSAKRAD